MSKIISVSGKAMRKLNTPQILKFGLSITWVASLLLLVTTIAGVQSQRHAIKTVGKDATPSIVTAQRLKDAMAGMDAYVANELLVESGKNQDAVAGYEERRKQIPSRLVAAAENITYGEKEEKPLEDMQLGLGDYMAKVQQARDFHAEGNAAKTLIAYREAADIMDKTLLPAADSLDTVNLIELERTYKEEKFNSAKSVFLVIVSGIFLLTVLIALQLFLSQRMRRTINPWLLAATAIAIIFFGYTIQSFISVSHALKVVKDDAFESMHALRQSRSLYYSANGDQSRYLLDPEKAAKGKHKEVFLEKIAKVATLPPGQNLETIRVALSQGHEVPGFGGLIADEFHNITFKGERSAALENIDALANYLSVDQQIRQLEDSNQHQEAINLLSVVNLDNYENNLKRLRSSGKLQEASNLETIVNKYKTINAVGAFPKLKLANQNTFDINQKAFDEAIAQSFMAVDGFEVIAPVAVGAIAVLTLFGLLPRLKEYSH